jgi:hypothetical protein
MIEFSPSEEVVKQQLSDETIELESVVEWKAKAKRGKNNTGDQDDLPIDKEELQPSILQKKSQSMEQLDEVIEEIRKLMLRSVEGAVNKEKMDIKEPA